MFEILAFPFKVVFGAIGVVFQIIGGVFEFVFGLVGGLFGLILWGAFIASMVGLVISIVHRKHETHHESDDEDFVSYYDKNAVK